MISGDFYAIYNIVQYTLHALYSTILSCLLAAWTRFLTKYSESDLRQCQSFIWDSGRLFLPLHCLITASGGVAAFIAHIDISWFK